MATSPDPDVRAALSRIDSRIEDLSTAARAVAAALDADRRARNAEFGFRRLVAVGFVVVAVMCVVSSALAVRVVVDRAGDLRRDRVEACLQQSELRADIRRSQSAMLDRISALSDDPLTTDIAEQAELAAHREVPELRCG